MSDVLISAENVGKKFCRDLRKSLWYGVKDSVNDLVGRTGESNELRDGEFWANQGIGFTLNRGECLGLIGRNGAGKTTLLKMLSGLVKPDAGSISMHGRVAAMISLGAGFNPVLTGRENIYVNGSILGLPRKRIHDRLDSIVDFAEIEDAIDSPVRTYSSGMKVRLGFATAANLIEPDILLLDEVLAVGDMGFTIKCLNTVRELTNRSAVIFVSHNMQLVSQFCSRVLLMADGQPKLLTSKVSEGLDAYLNLFEVKGHLSGDGGVDIQPLRIYQTSVSESSFFSGDPIYVEFLIRIDASVGPSVIHCLVKDNAQRPIINIQTLDQDGEPLTLGAGEHRFRCNLGKLDLSPGGYCIQFVVKERESQKILARLEGVFPFTIKAGDGASYIWAPLYKSAIAESIQ